MLGPGRNWRDRAAEAAAQLTPMFRAAGGSQQLHEIQAMTLLESWEVQTGIACFARVGAGKTLPIGLLPVLLQALGFTRPLIVVPGALRQKTEDEFRAMRQHWRVANQYALESYTGLAQVSKADLLEQLQPDVLLFDEPDPLRRIDTGATPKRIGRYVAGRRAKGLRTFCGFFSGTPEREGILDYLHMVRWALPDAVPPGEVCKAWSTFLDKGDDAGRGSFESYFGPVTDQEHAWELYRRWITGLRGCIISDDVYTGSTLHLSAYHVDPGLEREFQQLRQLWQRPDGWDLAQVKENPDELKNPDEVNSWSIWGVARQLALGFFYKADPTPPADWMRARKDWVRYVRDIIDLNQGWDTEKQVRIACERSLKPVPQWVTWRDIKDTFKPRSVPVWISNHAIDAARAWGERAPGVIWVDHTAFGHRLSQVTGWPFYGQKGLDVGGRSIEAEDGTRTVIASRLANQKGRNLQYAFHRALVMAMPNVARDAEQLIGRFMRQHQRSDTVHVDLYISCSEHYRALTNIERGGRATKGKMGLSQQWLNVGLQSFGDVPGSWAWR